METLREIETKMETLFESMRHWFEINGFQIREKYYNGDEYITYVKTKNLDVHMFSSFSFRTDQKLDFHLVLGYLNYCGDSQIMFDGVVDNLSEFETIIHCIGWDY